MPFLKSSPIFIFTEGELSVRSFLEDVYRFGLHAEITSAGGLSNDGSGLRMNSRRCLSVHQELPDALKKKLGSLGPRQKDLAEILLRTLFRPHWDNAYLNKWESTGQIFLVREAKV